MKHILLIVLLSVVAFTVHSQDLHLVSGNKTKTIKAGTFIELRLTSTAEVDDEGCSSNMMMGKFVGYENGQLKLAVRSIREPLIEENKIVGHYIKTYLHTEQPTISIPKDDVLSIKRRGEKGNNSPGEVLGTVLILLSFGTLTSAGIAEIDENNNGGLLLAIGLAELLSGTLLVTTFKYPEYITNPSCPGFTDNKKVWSIQ